MKKIIGLSVLVVLCAAMSLGFQVKKVHAGINGDEITSNEMMAMDCDGGGGGGGGGPEPHK